jgi:hypothetical protein
LNLGKNLYFHKKTQEHFLNFGGIKDREKSSQKCTLPKCCNYTQFKKQVLGWGGVGQKHFNKEAMML